MNNFKKGLASVIALSVFALVLSFAPSAGAYNDVNDGDWFAPYVEALTDAGVFNGSQASFRPADSMNRAEFVKTLVQAAGVSTSGAADAGFDDVSSSDWFAPFVNAAVENGIINGSDKSSMFRPGDLVTRAEAVKISLNALSVDHASYKEPMATFSDDNGHWAEEMISAAYNLSIVDGKGGSKSMFAPNEPIARAAVAKIAAYGIIVSEDPATYERFDDGSSAFSVFDADEIVTQVSAIVKPASSSNNDDSSSEDNSDDSSSDSDSSSDDEPQLVVSDGTLEVSLSPDTPGNVSLPSGVIVPVAKFDLTANGDSIKVTTIKVMRGGVGAEGTMSLILKDSIGNRVSKSKTPNSDDEITFTLLSGGLNIEAGDTKTVSLFASLGTATGQHNFSIASAEGVSSNSESVIGSFPVTSNTVEIVSGVTAGNLTMNDDGSPADVKVGEKGVTVAKFKLTNDNVEDILFKGITLKETGTASEASAIENMQLVVDGSTVAEGTFSDRYVAFRLTSPVLLEKGKNKKFTVRGDIIGEPAKTLIFDLEGTVDIEAEGKTYGYGSKVTDSFTANTVNVEAGAVAITSVEPNDKIRKNKTDVVLGTFKIALNSGQDVELEAVNAQVVTNTNNVDDLLENIELYDHTTGSVYDLTASATGATTITYYDRDLGISLSNGETRSFSVRADTKDTTNVANNTFKLSFSSIGDGTNTNGIELKETIDDNYITDVTPSSVSFKTITGESATVTLSIIALSATKNAVVGTQDVKALEFELKETADVSDILITELKVKDADAGTVFNKDLVSKIDLYKVDGSTETLVKSESGSQISSEEVTFDDIRVDLPRDTAARFLVKVSLVDDDTKNGESLNLRVSGYTMEDDEADNVYVAQDDGTGADTASDGTIGDAEHGASSVASARTVEVKGTGILYMAIDNTDLETDQSKYGLAGSESPFLASIEVRGENESIKIEDLQVTAAGNTATLDKIASSMKIYKEDKTTLVAEESITGNTVQFNSIDYVVGETAENLFIKLVLNPYGKDRVGVLDETAITFTASARDSANAASAEGVSSGNALSEGDNDNNEESGEIVYDGTAAGTLDDDATTATSASNSFGVIASRISSVELVDSFGGYTRATSLTGTGEYNAAIVKLTTDSHSNNLPDGGSLKMLLQSIKVALSKNSDMEMGAVTLEKINGQGSALTGTKVGVTTAGAVCDNTDTQCYVQFDTTAAGFATDDELGSGETAYFLVKVNIASMDDDGSADGTVNDDWIKVELLKLDGADADNDADGANFVWKDATAGANKFALRLDGTTKQEGVKINEAN